MTKMMYAKVMTAALAFLARKQGDTFGLFTINARHITTIQPRFEHQQFMRFLFALISAKPESTWKRDGLEHLFDHQGKEVIIFFTDLYDQDSDLLQFIRRLKTKRNEVIVFHILGQREMDLGFEGSFTFKDMEKNTTVKVDTRRESQLYAARIQEWIAQSRMNLLEKAIHYHPVTMSDQIHEVLRYFLTIRKNLRA